MPRTLLGEDQVIDSEFLSEQEHTDIGDGAPHHARAHSILGESDHTDVQTGTPTDGEFIVYDGVEGKWTNGACSNVWGQDQQHEFVETMTSTTSTTYQQRSRMSVTITNDGHYRLGMVVIYAQSSKNNALQLRMQRNDTETLCEMSPAQLWTEYPGAAVASAFFHLDLTAGTHNFDIDYSVYPGDNGTAYILCSRMEFWRMY